MNGNGILYIATIAPKNSPVIQHVQAVEQATHNAITSVGTFTQRRGMNRHHSTTPGVVLIDCNLPPKLHTWLQDVRHQWANAEIVVITTDPDIYIAMIPHGATALLDHSDPATSYSETIFRTSELRVRLSQPIANAILTVLVPQVPAQTFEQQEIDILSDIAQGMTNQQIVQRRKLSDDESPERHMYNLVTKLHKKRHP